jgi:predicted nucleic acid-binding protein
MSEYAVFDTSVLVDNWRTNRYAARMAELGLLIRNCSVVLAELWRGATTPEEKETLRILEKNHAVLTPTASHWIESGQVLSRMRDDHGFAPSKLRDLHFDLLIALTVRSHGAQLIASNRADFELIRKYREFNLEVW